MGICGSQYYGSTPSFAKLYEIDEKTVLGERKFAVVFKGRHRASGEPVAIKRIEKHRPTQQLDPSSRASRAFWEDEVAILKQCTHHDNIIECKHVFETPQHVLIVMEFVDGGELFDALISDGAYSEWDAKRFVKDTLEALTFLHERNIIHRDIKPENLLFTSRDSKAASIKVVNFAMAKMVHGESVVGNDQLTWPYCSPEILASLGGFSSRVESIRNAEAGNNASGTNSTNSSTDVSKQAIGVKCDIWSVGIVLYVLLSGAHPFDLDGRQTRDQIVGNILLGKFAMSGESSIWSQISREAKDLLTKFLDVDPEKRPSAAEALDHEWFASPDTPRSPLSVSVSDGLGQYQRLMRTKFRASVLVTMAAETFRRSLQKHRDSLASAEHAATAPSSEIDASACIAPTSADPESIRRVESAVDSSADERVGSPTSSMQQQGSVMSRVFRSQHSERLDAVPVDHREIDPEGLH